MNNKNPNNCNCRHDNEVYIGKPAPDFTMEAYLPDGTFGKVSLQANKDAKKWTILYFYPANFTFVCPTEIRELSKLTNDFQEQNAEIIAVSVDSTFAHMHWFKGDLGRIEHPMASDKTHKYAKLYRVYDEEKGVSWRGLFIIDPEGILWIQYVTNGEVGRSAQEVLRLLQAAKAAKEGKLVPCNWQPSDAFLEKK